MGGGQKTAKKENFETFNVWFDGDATASILSLWQVVLSIIKWMIKGVIYSEYKNGKLNFLPHAKGHLNMENLIFSARVRHLTITMEKQYS